MKVIYLLGALALTTVMSCNTAPKEETVKVVEAEAPAAEPTVEKEKTTSIKVGSDGGSIKTENVEIEIDNNEKK